MHCTLLLVTEHVVDITARKVRAPRPGKRQTLGERRAAHLYAYRKTKDVFPTRPSPSRTILKLKRDILTRRGENKQSRQGKSPKRRQTSRSIEDHIHTRLNTHMLDHAHNRCLQRSSLRETAPTAAAAVGGCKAVW